MLHVILLILKILGIIFLVLILLVLLILASVLFVPVTWKARLQKETSTRAAVSAAWLFHAVSAKFLIDEADGWGQDLNICLFGIPVLRPLEEKKLKQKKRKKKKDSPGKQKAHTDTEQHMRPEPEPQKEPEPEKEPELEKERENSSLPAPVPVRKEEKDSFLARIMELWRKAAYAIRKFCDKIKHIPEQLEAVRGKLKELQSTKNIYLEFWNREEHRRARAAIIKEGRYLLRKLRPRKIEGDVTFGFEDPANTGICMGAVGILYAWYPDRLRIIPDFEREVLAGNVLIKGRIHLYVLVCILWRLFFNRDVRNMYRNWKQL